MRNLVTKVLIVALALVSTALSAEPVRLDRDDTGGRLVLDAALGSSWQDVNIGRLAIRTASHQERLDVGGSGAPSAKSRRLALAPRPDGGCALIIADIGPGFEKGRPDAWQRVTHATKIIDCGSSPPDALTVAHIERRRAAGSIFMAKTGSRAELQPLANPATLRPGADLPVRVYCDGAARAGIELAAVHPDGSRRYATTDAVGAVVMRIDSAGSWRFEAHCQPRARGGDTPPLVATLSVDVLDADAWSYLEGAN